MPRTSAPRVDRRTRAARTGGRTGREDVLAAAATVFARRGYREASVDEIAREAGLSKGALYWHFASKEDVFFALLDERIDGPIREATELLATAPPERDMSVEASRVFGELLGRNREVVMLEHEYWAFAARDERLRERYLVREAALRRAFASALEARARHLGLPAGATRFDELATALLALVRGLASERLVSPDTVPDELVGEMFGVIYAGLAARAGSARSDDAAR